MTPRDDADPTWDHHMPNGPRGASQAPPAQDSAATQAAPARTVPVAQVEPQRAGLHHIGRFAILEKVGEGGMGVVYRAVDTGDPRRREVAVKVLRPHIAYDPQARVRLAREVDTLERVYHPGVAAVIAADPHGEQPYIATEFVPGIPLDELVKQRGPFDPGQLADLGGELAEAIRAIHQAGVVHRDLKPSNVLMVGRRPVLIDFGIAHIADDARLTSTGLVMGTPGYLSPELVEGAPVSTSTDWWGWAATLAFAAQGEPPFGRGPMSAVLDRVTRGQCNLSEVDERLRPLLGAALSPVPSERPSADEVVAQMERYARGEPTSVVLVRGGPARGAAGNRAPRPAAAETSMMPRADATRVATQHHTSAPPQPDRHQPTWGAPQQNGLPHSGQPQNLQQSQEPYTAYAGQVSEPAAQAHPAGASKSQSRPGEHDPRINLPYRSGTLQALFLLWVAITALAPVAGLILLVVWNVAARVTDSTLTQTVLRRFEAGRRKSDSAVAVASAPWHVTRAVVATLVAFILPALVFACVGSLTAVSWAAVQGGVPRAWWGLPILFGAAAGQYTMWRGAGSVSYRRGSRSLVRGIVPSDTPTKIVVGVVVALGLFMLLGALQQHGDITWSPLTGGLPDPLAKYLPDNGGVR